jgi:hypothetical protein
MQGKFASDIPINFPNNGLHGMSYDLCHKIVWLVWQEYCIKIIGMSCLFCYKITWKMTEKISLRKRVECHMENKVLVTDLLKTCQDCH